MLASSIQSPFAERITFQKLVIMENFERMQNIHSVSTAQSPPSSYSSSQLRADLAAIMSPSISLAFKANPGFCIFFFSSKQGKNNLKDEEPSINIALMPFSPLKKELFYNIIRYQVNVADTSFFHSLN